MLEFVKLKNPRIVYVLEVMMQNFGICFFDIFRRPVWDETLTSLETNHLISLSFLTFAFQNSGQRMWEAV